MSAFKPRKVAAASFFVTDQREEKKFWYLDPVVQPVVHVNADGTFEDPAARVTVPTRFAIAMGEADAIPGNGNWTPGVPGEVWDIRSITMASDAGANYSVEDDGVIISEVVAIGALATAELITVVSLIVAGGSIVTINNGLLADAWNVRAVRLV